MILCRLSDIDDPGGRGFNVVTDWGMEQVFVVRKGSQIYGYINRCPHTGTPLDWKPDIFLNYDKNRIQCSTHGAQFRIEDGFCLAGPCPGRSLVPFQVKLEDGAVITTEATGLLK